ncbi:MAG TPA: M15 family metallopeptidase [Acidimicrobiales bacterium]|nr:M15 family metallopeptidase [Acidimicrobiales bacterium]
MRRAYLLVGWSALALLLGACGGGGSSQEDRAGSGAPTTPAPLASTAAPPTSASTTALPPSTTTTTARKAPPPPGLIDVQELEPSILVALNKLTAENFTGRPLPGYEANRAFLTAKGAEALAAVQRRLATQGLGLKVYDAYRPARATRAMVAWARGQGRADLVGPYIASVSYHNSGQAVDLTLVDRATGRELDMGTPYETFDPAAHTANATGVAAQNRAVLVEAMHAEGFANYEGEWWHFNYLVPGAVVLDEPVR